MKRNISFERSVAPPNNMMNPTRFEQVFFHRRSLRAGYHER
jgi:hypothetical protein